MYSRSPDSGRQAPRSLYLKGLLFLLTLYVLLQFLLPAAGDEAYFISWGKVFSWGYYDHPGAPGWLSYLIWRVNAITGMDGLVWMHRLVIGLLELFNLWVLYRYLRFNGSANRSTGLIFLLASLPAHIIIFSLYLNDSLLAIFLLQFFLCVGFSWRSRDQVARSYAFIVAAGVFLGLAFLSKYITVVFYCALVLSLLLTKDKRRFLFTKMALASVIGFSLLGVNLYWNYFNCQINFVFNFLLRDGGGYALLQGPMEFLFSVSFLLGPVLLLVWKYNKEIIANRDGLFSHFFVVTLAVFLLVAIIRGHFGLHWGAAIMFLAVLAVAEVVDADGSDVARYSAWNLKYSALIIIPLLIVSVALMFNVPVVTKALLKKGGEYTVNQALDVADGSLAAAINARVAEDVIVSTTSYGLAAMLDVAGIKQTRFMFTASKYGRNDDIAYDYREMAGTDVLFLPVRPDELPQQFEAYFTAVDSITLKGHRGVYHAFLGHGFNYEHYRDRVLLPLMDKLYNYIPSLQGACYMDRYR